MGFSESTTATQSVQKQYERWPYPYVPLIATLHREQLWQINIHWLNAACGQPLPPQTKPKIWITGCGTFQPYVFARANPDADILATDLSRRSLELAERRCKFHGIKNVRFEQIDLDDPTSFPQEEFDFIESYGVLMCLPDPQKSLKYIQEKLKPHGVMRIMVYPHYGRQRIFQIQRLAKILGFDYQEKNHPAELKKLMKRLPKNNPLHYAFFSYSDSRNPQGIVDGFLHPSDRAFTGIELSHLIDKAGLMPACFFHRPWGQPASMATKLQLEPYCPALMLHYLDLWQELGTNYILCLTRKEATPQKTTVPKTHPLFDKNNKTLDLRHRLRLKRLGLSGALLESKTHAESLPLSAREVRQLTSGQTDGLNGHARQIIPGADSTQAQAVFLKPLEELKPWPQLFCISGNNVPNPFYTHLFAAYRFEHHWPQTQPSKVAPLKEQIRRWQEHAYPLEDDVHRFGLTPFGTHQHAPELVAKGLAQLEGASHSLTADAFRLSDETHKFREVKDFLKTQSGIPNKQFHDADLRELWLLLFSYPQLLLDIEEA